MSTQEEREEDAVKSDELIKLASGKNKEAAKYLYMLSRVERVLDDIYDADFPVTRGDVLEIIEHLFIGIPSNRFFIQHQAKLTIQHVPAYNAWEAANRWSGGSPEQKVFSHVWRDECQSILSVVALLTQGINKMKLVDKKVRATFCQHHDFDINKLGE